MSGPAVVGVPANNNGGVSAHAVVTRPPTKNVSAHAVVGVPARSVRNVCKVGGPAVVGVPARSVRNVLFLWFYCQS